MSRIKGRYIGEITIDFDYDEDMENVIDFEKMENALKVNLSYAIESVVKDEIVRDLGEVFVIRDFSDLNRVKDE